MDPVPVAVDDEQRVVDADAKPDHRADRHRELRNREQVREQRGERRAETDAGARHCDRQPHRQHRAERQNQHDDGEGEPDELRLGRLELRKRVTGDLDLQAGLIGGKPGDPGSDLRGPPEIDVRGEVHAGVRGAAIGADLAPLLDVRGERCVANGRGLAIAATLMQSIRRVRAGQGHALDGRDLLQHLLDGGAHLRVVDAGLGAEDDRPAGAAGEFAEVLLEHLPSVAAIGCGRVEPGIEARAHRKHRDDHRGDQRDPDRERLARIAEAPDAEPGKHRIPRAGGRIAEEAGRARTHAGSARSRPRWLMYP